MCSAISIIAFYTIHAVVAFLMNVETCFRSHLDRFLLAFTGSAYMATDTHSWRRAWRFPIPSWLGICGRVTASSLLTYTDGCLWFIRKFDDSLVRACFGWRRWTSSSQYQHRYDLILSFNLLQRSYCPPDIIEAGVRNLAASLCEGGLLIIGNEWESLRAAFKKPDGRLILACTKGSALPRGPSRLAR